MQTTARSVARGSLWARLAGMAPRRVVDSLVRAARVLRLSTAVLE